MSPLAVIVTFDMALKFGGIASLHSDTLLAMVDAGGQLSDAICRLVKNLMFQERSCRSRCREQNGIVYAAPETKTAGQRPLPKSIVSAVLRMIIASSLIE
jgi:hypothetical protein